MLLESRHLTHLSGAPAPAALPACPPSLLLARFQPPPAAAAAVWAAQLRLLLLLSLLMCELNEELHYAKQLAAAVRARAGKKEATASLDQLLSRKSQTAALR